MTHIHKRKTLPGIKSEENEKTIWHVNKAINKKFKKSIKSSDAKFIEAIN